MTKEKCMELLTRQAAIIEESRRLNEEEGGIFCLGVDIYREIHISQTAWPKVIDALQPVVTYNPNWKSGKIEKVDAHFFLEIFGNKYKIFALLEKEGKAND